MDRSEESSLQQPVEAGENPPRSGSRLLFAARRLVGWESPDVRGLRGAFKRAIQRYLDWNRRLLLDPQMRYSAVVRLLERRFLNGTANILDVGSGPTGLAFVLQRPVVSVDIQFDASAIARHRPPIIPVKASAARLPFRDQSFDAVVSMDLMEHLPKAIRGNSIRELLRVARSLVIVGFPFGPASARFDARALAEEARRGIDVGWRKEHVRQGVPGPEIASWISVAADDEPRGASVRHFGQEGLGGLRLRWKLQFLIGRDSRFYGLVYAPLYWIHGRGRPRKAYRRIFVVEIGVQTKR